MCKVRSDGEQGVNATTAGGIKWLMKIVRSNIWEPILFSCAFPAMRNEKGERGGSEWIDQTPSTDDI
jgi:hypothetical protein